MTSPPPWPDWAGCFALRREAPDSTTPWRFDSWWSLVEGREELLFGWSFEWSTASPEELRWRLRHNEQPKVRHLSICAPRAQMEVLLRELGQGRALTDASQAAGLDAPPAELADVQLPQSNFTVAPWRLLPSRGSYANEISSPIEDRPAMRSALVRLDKGRILPTLDEAASKILDHLAKETGLAFEPGTGRSGIDLPRLGDLELLVFPPAGALGVSAGSQAIELTLDTSMVGARTEIFVRCRQTHAGAVLADTIERLPPVDEHAEDPSSRRTSVPTSPVGPSGASIEVWHVLPKDGSWRLVTTHEHRWIRQIRLGLSAMGTRAEFRAGWLDRWAEQRRASKQRSARADAMRGVQQFTADRVSTIGEPDVQWSAAEQGVATLAERLAPPRSGGLWLPRGDDPGSDPGKQRVAEWFREEFGSARDASRVLIIDPDFDEFGLDLIARIPSTNRVVLVVTTLQGDEARQAQTRERLARTYDQLGALHQSLSVSVFTVPPAQLHDRMILELVGRDDDTTMPKRGFHLSHSLQSASERHALLITPIPRDILASVADGVAQMLEGLSPLLSPADLRPRRHSAPLAPDSSESPGDPADSERQLIAATESGDLGPFTNALAVHVDRLYSTMRSLNESALALAGRWPTEIALSPLLRRQLDAHTIAPRKGERRVEVLALEQHIRRDFVEQRGGSTHWTHWRGDETTGADVIAGFGLALLLAIDPVEFAALWSARASGHEGESIEQQTQRGRWLLLIRGLLEDYYALARIVPEQAARTRALIEAGLAAPSPFVRSTLAALLGLLLQPYSRASVDADGRAVWSLAEGKRILSQLERADERVLAIGRWVSDMRIQGNRMGGVEDEALRERREATFALIVEDWQPSFDRKLLATLVRSCEGPGRPGAWADSTLNDLLLPLNAGGKLAAVDIVDVWLVELETRIAELLDDRHHFYSKDDTRLTEVCVWLCGVGLGELVAIDGEEPDAAHARVQTGLERLAKLHTRASTTANRPFIRGLNYTRWNSARRALLWLGAFATLFELYGDEASSARAFTRCWQIRYDPKEHDVQDPTGMFSWLRQLDAAVEASRPDPAEPS